ncbi:hypothetical protein KFL_005550020 [Klebsormidium nitens]|uniref:Uncharacterized protein n=1 Tax=Klebsormidium nitens TaxID=105231 RepID=A0A1Y1ILS2_KLENI|nr:hypothetical protein KFL_005550020 [Klebsormidium nitens]|eukprot:GAQ89716.1 hypothetical protein KFL_005550020 [Klebsormidium nitens]
MAAEKVDEERGTPPSGEGERPYLTKEEVEALGPKGLEGQQAWVYITPTGTTLTVDAGKRIVDYEELREHQCRIIVADLPPSSPIIFLMNPTITYFKGNRRYRVYRRGEMSDWQYFEMGAIKLWNRVRPKWGKEA